MPSHRLPLVFACALALSAGFLPREAAAQAAPNADADAAARQAFEAGQEAYDRGRFSEALSQFERAYALSPRPKLLFNIGRAAESDLRAERAISAYEAYLRAFPRADNKEFVEARLAKLREFTGQRSPAAAPAPPPAPPPAVARAPAPIVVPAPASSLQPYVSPSAAKPASPSAQAPTPYVSSPSPLQVERPRADARLIPGLRIYGGFRIGTGGTEKATFEYLGDKQTNEAKLASTLGMQFGAGYAWRFFAVGGELRVNWMKEKMASNGFYAEPERSKFVDLVVKPKAGYQLRTIPLEFYATLPFGVSVPVDDTVSSGSTELKIEAGPTVGFFVGASYFFTKHLGINAELGWLGAWYNVGVSADSSGGSASSDITLTYTQWSPLTVNLMAAF